VSANALKAPAFKPFRSEGSEKRDFVDDPQGETRRLPADAGESSVRQSTAGDGSRKEWTLKMFKVIGSED